MMKSVSAWVLALLLASGCSPNDDHTCDVQSPSTDDFCYGLAATLREGGAVVLGDRPDAYVEGACDSCVWIYRFEVHGSRVLAGAAGLEGSLPMIVYDGAQCLERPPSELPDYYGHNHCRRALDSPTDGVWMLVPLDLEALHYNPEACIETFDAGSSAIWEPVQSCTAPYLRLDGGDSWEIGEDFTVTADELAQIVEAAKSAVVMGDLDSFPPDRCREIIEGVTGRPVTFVPGPCY